MSQSPINSVDLGLLIGLTSRQVRRLSRDGVLQRVGPGRHDGFDPYLCVPAFLEYVRRGAERTESIAHSRQRLIDSQFRASEFKNRQKERELVPIEQVNQCFEAAMTAVAASLDGLGGRLCNELAALADPGQISKRIFDETRRIRNTAAGALEALAGAPAGSQGAEGPDAPKRRRVGGRVSHLAAG